MKQILIRRGQVNVENVPAPIVEEGHVLVEVAYSLISTGTEASSVADSGKPLIKQAVEQPEKVRKLINHLADHGIQKTLARLQGKVGDSIEVGYSCAGTVIQVGNGVDDILPGDQVACGGAGLANHAEIVLVPRNLVVKVPEGCSLKKASSVTMGAIAMQGVRRSNVRLGETVAVIGLGLLGQITAQLLLNAGCKVIGIDIDKRRLDLAKKLGTDYVCESKDIDDRTVINNLTDGHGVDASIITAASTSDEIVQQAMEMTRKKGKVVVVGAVGLGLRRSPFYEKEIDFLISTSYGPGRYDETYENRGIDYPYAYVRWTENRNMAEYLRLIADEKIELDEILESEYEIVDAPKAYEALQALDEKPLGIVLSYHASEKTPLANKLQNKVLLKKAIKKGKIGVAVIGAGSFAQGVHLPNLLKLSDIYTIRAIMERNGAKAKDTAEKFGAIYATTNLEDVLSDQDVHMVIIATRHNLHADLTCQAAEAGKAIFLEKPMALNLKELEKIETVLTQTGVPFMIGFNRRFSPAASRMKKLLSSRINPLMIHYRVNAGYLPPDHWTQTHEGGGRIIGEACHMIDLFKYLVDGSPVTEISMTALSANAEHILSTDNKIITLRYEDGSVANLLYTALGNLDYPKEYVEVYTDNKVMVINDFRELRIYGDKRMGWSGVQDKGHLEELILFGNYINGSFCAPILLKDMVEATRISIITAEEI